MNAARVKRVVVFVIFFLLLVMLLPVQDTFAASASYQSSDGQCKEKIGNSFIWIDVTYDEKGWQKSAALMTSTVSADDPDARALKKLGSTKYFGYNIITNGNTIFYTIKGTSDFSTIYKVTVSGKTRAKVKSVKYLGSIAAYYNGKIYYTRATNEYAYDYNLYSYSLKTKKTVLIKKHFCADSQYGQYITGATEKAFDIRNTKHCIVDLKTGKTYTMPVANESITDGKRVYYWKYTSYDYDTMRIELRSCNLKGKDVKIIRKLPSGVRNLMLGISSGQYVDSYGRTVTIDYETGELTVAESI